MTYRIVHQCLQASDQTRMQWTVGHATIQQLQNGQQLRNALQIDEAQHKAVRRCTQRRFQRIQQRCVQVDFAV